MPETPFERRVIQDALWWQEYGCPVNPRDLPEYEYKAHFAVLEGKAKKRREEQRDAERESPT